MTTYLTIFGKKATLANNKKEASTKLGVSVGRVHMSDVHIDFLKDYEIVK